MTRPEKGNFCVDVGRDYQDIRLLMITSDKGSPEKLFVAYQPRQTSERETMTDEERKTGFLRRPIEECTGSFFPSVFFRKRNEGILTNSMIKMYARIQGLVDAFLYDQSGYRASISALEKHLTEDFGEPLNDVRVILKVLIAESFIYSYNRTKSDEFIGFSKLKTDAQNSKIYYGSLADELRVKSEKIGLLVSHHQTVGNYREYLLRNMLKKYIPSKFSVATGFIEGISYQIDIIIYDSHNHSPTFIEGDLVVVKREAVRAIIEVKSNLTSAKLKEALTLFYDITRPGIFKPDIPIFKGVFAFDTSYKDSKGIAKAIKKFYFQPYFEPQLHKKIARGLSYLYREVSCVTVLNKNCVFSQYRLANGKEEDNMIPFLLSISEKRQLDVQSAMFMSMLFDYLDMGYYSKKSTFSSFTHIYQSNTSTVRIEEKLTPDDWKPNTGSENEHDFTPEGVKERIRKVHDWFIGKTSTTSYLNELFGDEQSDNGGVN